MVTVDFSNTKATDVASNNGEETFQVNNLLLFLKIYFYLLYLSTERFFDERRNWT